MLDKNSKAFKKWQEVGKALKAKKRPGVKGIEEMNLSELLEAENKFLKWFPTTNHPERHVKEHIYNSYIKPRIEKLTLEKNIEDTLLS